MFEERGAQLHCRQPIGGSSIPRKDAAAVAAVAARAARLKVSFVIGLDSVSLGAFHALPLLLGAMLPPVMFLNAYEVT